MKMHNMKNLNIIRIKYRFEIYDLISCQIKTCFNNFFFFLQFNLRCIKSIETNALCIQFNLIQLIFSIFNIKFTKMNGIYLQLIRNCANHIFFFIFISFNNVLFIYPPICKFSILTT